MLDFLSSWWPYLAFVVDITISLLASAHVVLNKRDVRSAIGWCGIIWLAPLLGSVLYLLFGVNRIARRAQTLRANRLIVTSPRSVSALTSASGRAALTGVTPSLQPLAQLVGKVTDLPLLGGNQVKPLVSGRDAYPAMLAAIERAEHSIGLTTYIFDNDLSGQLFVAALSRAAQRGVEVCVIVDDVGRRYSWNTILRPLNNAGVRVTQFLPTFVPWHFRYANLRNHRKILVIDGQTGFTGGMNIRHGNTLDDNCRSPIQDLHFQVEGPVVEHLRETFVADWRFCTGEALVGDKWFPPLTVQGEMLARGIPDGPDEDFEKLRLTLLGAIACAQKSILIVTPYFIPDDTIIASLNVAALRGVQVDVIIPLKSNLRLVQWAVMPVVSQLLASGVRVWRSQPPFDHSKLAVVDGEWTLMGSANWDARSLRLNFEYNVEVFDAGLAAKLTSWAHAKFGDARPLTQADLSARPFIIKLRDGVARLASPYL